VATALQTVREYMGLIETDDPEVELHLWRAGWWAMYLAALAMRAAREDSIADYLFYPWGYDVVVVSK
jgi:hypothetical protein